MKDKPAGEESNQMQMFWLSRLGTDSQMPSIAQLDVWIDDNERRAAELRDEALYKLDCSNAIIATTGALRHL